MTQGGARGHLIVFEGPDGVGKTTLAQALVEELRQQDVRCEYISFPGRDPGTLGRLVYDVHHDPATFGIDHIEPASLQVLHVAAHLDAIGRRILPALEAGYSVIMDRFWWSTVVYGNVGGVSHDVLDAMIELERQGWGEVEPTAVFVVTRRNPLRVEGPDERWQLLRNAYEELAREQAKLHTVNKVANEGPLNEALMQVVWALEGKDGL